MGRGAGGRISSNAFPIHTLKKICYVWISEYFRITLKTYGRD